jgi:glycosyltransferase involved in cell wall biosynthesis
MPELPLVTIGISTFNRASSYLPHSLDSALAQTYRNLEIIVSDNCSSDRTSAEVRRRATNRLRYFRQPQNIGANANFNFCLEQARGHYFLLLHDDDLIDPDFVESCVNALQRSGRCEVGVIRTGTRVIDHENRTKGRNPNLCLGLSPTAMFLAWFRRETAFYLCSTLFNTDRLREQGGFVSRTDLFQDVTALARLAVLHGRLDVPAVKASFRRHDQNKGSGESALAWAEDSLYLLELLEELLPEHAQELRAAGLPYLSRKCYRVARAIPSWPERWRTYYRIYNRFERSFSPVRYTLKRLPKDARATLRRWRRADRPRATAYETDVSEKSV